MPMEQRWQEAFMTQMAYLRIRVAERGKNE